MDRTKSSIIIGSIFSAAAFSAAPAAADDAEDAFRKFSECAVIEADQDRLACYDSMTNVMRSASEKFENSSRIQQAQQEAFGAEDFLEDEQLEEIERKLQLVSPVEKIQVTQSRLLKITLANGQVWLQRTDDRVIPAPEEGVEHTAVIRRLRFGGYRLELEPEGRTIRVKRLQ